MQAATTLLRLDEAAERLGISERTLRRWHDAGHATFVAVGPFDRKRITAEEVDRLRALMTNPRPVAS